MDQEECHSDLRSYKSDHDFEDSLEMVIFKKPKEVSKMKSMMTNLESDRSVTPIMSNTLPALDQDRLGRYKADLNRGTTRLNRRDGIYGSNKYAKFVANKGNFRTRDNTTPDPYNTSMARTLGGSFASLPGVGMNSSTLTIERPQSLMTYQKSLNNI